MSMHVVLDLPRSLKARGFIHELVFFSYPKPKRISTRKKTKKFCFSCQIERAETCARGWLVDFFIDKIDRWLAKSERATLDVGRRGEKRP